MTFTPDMLRTIAKNAGKVPKHNLANDLGISVSFLERKAREHGYDLRIIAERDPDADMTTSAAHPLPRPTHPPSENGRSVTVKTSLFARDVAALDAIGASVGIARARVISRVIENARERGLLRELARLPAPMPTGREGA